jgi:hypothetical protein
MKNLPAILVLLVVGMADVRAQYFSTDEITSNPFALTYGVDSRLTLFTPDTGAQILFNPARAMRYQRQFIVGKYDGYPSYPFYSLGNDIVFAETQNNFRVTIERLSPPISYSYVPAPTVDVAVLKKEDDGYWLFQLTNIVSASDYDFNSSLSRIVSATDRSSSSYHYTQENRFSKTRFKISKIFSLKDAAYSYSLFGFYLPNTGHGNSLNSITELYEYTTYKYNRVNKSLYDTKYTNPKYSLGIEMSVANDDSDLIFSLRAVKGKNEQSSDRTSEYRYTYFYYNDSSLNNVSANSNVLQYSLASDPTTVIVSGYFHRSMMILGLPANVFGSVAGSYLKGDISLVMKRMYYNYYKYGVSNPTGDTSVAESAGKIDRTNYGLSMCIGAITTFELDGITVQAGFVPQFDYSTTTNGQIEYDYTADQILMRYDNSYYNLTVVLPFMITYSPADWLTIFSGLNTRYSLYISDSENKSLPLTVFYRSSSGSSSSPQTTQSNGSSSSTSYSSGSSLFLNAQLQHQSGLKVQLSFKDDITKFRELGLSVMYFF